MSEVGIIFDTNAYRGFTYGLSTEQLNEKLSELKDLENQNGVTTFGYPFVMLELAAHLADPNDAAYENCKLASMAFTRHCNKSDEQNKGLRLVADSESQLCKILHKELPKTHVDTTRHLIHIFQFISDYPNEQQIDKIRGDLKDVSALVKNTEERFVADFWNSVVLGFVPEAKDWQPLKDDKMFRKRILDFLKTEEALLQIAKMNVLKTYILLRKKIDNRVDEMSKYVLEKFRPPTVLYNEIVKRLVMSGFDLTKENRENFVWDIQIAFLVGTEHAIGNHPLRLITADKMIIEAAEKSGCRNLVYSFDEYWEKLINKKPI